MRVHVISDIEGVAGVVRRGQIIGADAPLYLEARRLYTGEINAAVRGAKAAGATEIVVMDCHGAGGDYDFNSLVAEDLDPDCEFVIQYQWTEYTGFLEEGCDAALLVGMHAMAGTPNGVLSHTVYGQAWQSLKFNGTLVGEIGITAAMCGNWGCPVALVAGDTAACREATALLGDALTTVGVKTGLGRFSVRSKTPTRARELIEDGAKRALKSINAVSPYDPGRPSEIEIAFTTPDRLEEYRNRRGVEVIDPMTIVARGDDWWQTWSSFFS